MAAMVAPICSCPPPNQRPAVERRLDHLPSVAGDEPAPPSEQLGRLDCILLALEAPQDGVLVDAAEQPALTVRRLGDVVVRDLVRGHAPSSRSRRGRGSSVGWTSSKSLSITGILPWGAFRPCLRPSSAPRRQGQTQMSTTVYKSGALAAWESPGTGA